MTKQFKKQIQAMKCPDCGHPVRDHSCHLAGRGGLVMCSREKCTHTAWYDSKECEGLEIEKFINWPEYIYFVEGETVGP